MFEGGGTVQNTLKGSGTEKRGGETKISKRGSKLGQGVGALKGGGELKPPYKPPYGQYDPQWREFQSAYSIWPYLLVQSENSVSVFEVQF